MEKHEDIPFDEYRSHAVNNEFEIVSSKKCGCFFCRSIFDARKVSDWITDERGTSALCPECGMDAVIGDASGVPFDKPLLKTMNLLYYGSDYMENNPDGCRVYCQRYLAGDITHKPSNEALFLRYATSLADKGDPVACLIAARFYDQGGDYIPSDPAKALYYYKQPCLKSNSEALIQLGNFYERHLEEDANYANEAYRCYSLSSGLGDLAGVYRLALAYINGIGVPSDESIGYSLLENGFMDVLDEFIDQNGSKSTFAFYCYGIGKCWQYGIGTEKDELNAVRFYLLSYLPETTGIDAMTKAVLAPIYDEVEKEMHALSGKLKLRKGAPVFDQDTFYDSFLGFGSEESPKTFSLVEYSPAEGKLVFEVRYDKPVLIIDVGNQYCGFVDGAIRWEFSNIAMFKMSPSGSKFERIEVGQDDTLRFVHMDGDNKDHTIAELRFAADLSSLKVKGGKK